MPENNDVVAVENGDRVQKLKNVGKIVLYIVVLILLFLLSGTGCFLFSIFLSAGLPLWLEITLGVIAGFLILGSLAGIWTLNHFLPVRVVGSRFFMVMYWVGWTIPVLSAVIGIVSIVAKLLGYEIEVDTSHSHHHHHIWDWD